MKYKQSSDYDVEKDFLQYPTVMNSENEKANEIANESKNNEKQRESNDNLSEESQDES